MTLRMMIDKILDFDFSPILAMAVGVIFVAITIFLCLIVMNFFSKRS
jgi:hypothetical protein